MTKQLTFLNMIAAKIMNNYEKLPNMIKVLTYSVMTQTPSAQLLFAGPPSLKRGRTYPPQNLVPYGASWDDV